MFNKKHNIKSKDVRFRTLNEVILKLRSHNIEKYIFNYLLLKYTYDLKHIRDYLDDCE